MDSKYKTSAFWLWLFTVSRPFLCVFIGSFFLIIGGINEAPMYWSLPEAIGYTLTNVWGWVGLPLTLFGIVWILRNIIVAFANINSKKR